MNQQFGNFSPLSADNSTGRKTHFWFRVYCISLAIVYLLVTILGVFLAVSQPQTREYNSNEIFFIGIIYAVLGIVLFIPFAVAPLLPRRPWVWIYGIVLIAIGMTSGCCLPFCIPLLIFWIKPETKAIFGR